MSHEKELDPNGNTEMSKDKMLKIMIEKFNKEGDIAFETFFNNVMTLSRENSSYQSLDFLDTHKSILKEFYCYGYTDAKIDTTLKIIKAEDKEWIQM